MGHQVKELSEDEEIMTLGCTHVVGWKKDEKNFKVLVMIKDKLDEKHINRMGQLMSKEYSCNKGVIYAGNSILPKSFYSLANECDIEIIDKEDLLAIAKRIDLKKI